MDELQKKIVDYVEANGKTYQQIALEIHEKPEVSNYEFFASKRLADQIKSVGFEVEMPAAGHRTGFAASYKSGKPGPVMVFLAWTMPLWDLDMAVDITCLVQLLLWRLRR